MRQEPYYTAVRHLIGRRAEAASRYYGKLVRFGSLLFRQRAVNPLIAALHAAYRYHYPVVISPDVIWFTIAQGLARHIRLHAEALRDKFVSHSGQKELIVRRDDFLKGSPENPWPEAFAEFSEQIRDHIGTDKHGLFVADFSTTTPTTRADAMQPYFRYRFLGLCGIPSVILEGTPDDWHAIVNRVKQFEQFGLTRWITAVVPVLDAIAQSAEGKPDRDFWDEIYIWRQTEGCNPTYVRGWVKLLFPYVKGEGANGSVRLVLSPIFWEDPRSWAPAEGSRGATRRAGGDARQPDGEGP